MKTKLLFLLLLSSQLAFSQTKLTGYVTLQNSGKKSAFPAIVKSFGATDTDVRTADGYYELVYDRKKPGNDAELEIVRDGYEVVNKEALSVRLPEDHQKQRPHKIFLCPKGQWQRYADQYYKVNLRAINQTYEQQLKAVQKKYQSVTLENQEYRTALAQLDESRKSAEAQAQDLAERFAKANLDDATDRFVLAHRLFTEGKIDSVLIVLPEEELDRDLARANREIAQGKDLIQIGQDKVANGEEAKEKIVEEYMVKARAYIIKFQWAEAERSFDKAVAADRTNIDNLTEFGFFLHTQNQHQKAISFFEKSLMLSPNENLSSILKIVLCRFYSVSKMFAEAEKTCFEAIFYLEKIPVKDSLSRYDDFASINQSLGVLYLDKNQLYKAELYLKEALKVLEKISSRNENFLYNIAEIKLYLGEIHWRKNAFKEAELYTLEALEIHKKLSNKDLSEQRLLASILTNLGKIYHNQKELNKAEPFYSHALDILHRLSHKNVKAHFADLTITISNYAQLHIDLSNLTKAKFLYLDAIRLYKESIEEENNIHESTIAYFFYKTALICKDINDLKMEEVYLNQSLTILNKLVQVEKDKFQDLWLQVLINLEDLYQKQFSDSLSKINAISLQKKIIYIRDLFYKAFPEKGKSFLSEAIGNLAWYYLVIKDFKNAELNSIKGLEIDNSQIWIKTNLAYSLLFQNRYKEAEAIYNQFKGKPYDDKRTWTEVFLVDLAELEKAGITHPDVAKVRKLLRE